MMLVEIDRATLAGVSGAGESSTRVDVGPVHYQHSTSDYQACLARMHHLAEREHPNNAVWPFTSDSNARARAHAEAYYIGHYCGRPQQSAPRLRGSTH